MSTDYYYDVSEFFLYQGFDVADTDSGTDVVVSETTNFDDIKDRLEKLIELIGANPEDETVSEFLEKKQTLIYRFSLPFDASTARYQKFKRNIEWIKSKNPQWEIIPDMPKLEEESEAWIMIYKDENYLNSRISYLINTSISSSLI